MVKLGRYFLAGTLLLGCAGPETVDNNSDREAMETGIVYRSLDDTESGSIATIGSGYGVDKPSVERVIRLLKGLEKEEMNRLFSKEAEEYRCWHASLEGEGFVFKEAENRYVSLITDCIDGALKGDYRGISYLGEQIDKIGGLSDRLNREKYRRAKTELARFERDYNRFLEEKEAIRTELEKLEDLASRAEPHLLNTLESMIDTNRRELEREFSYTHQGRLVEALADLRGDFRKRVFVFPDPEDDRALKVVFEPIASGFGNYSKSIRSVLSENGVVLVVGYSGFGSYVIRVMDKGEEVGSEKIEALR